MILAWMFIPLEHPRWQRIRARHSELYPHINPDRPRPLDPARYLIQAVWLVATSSQRDKNAALAQLLPRSNYVNAITSGWINCPTASATKPAIWITIKSSGTSTRACGVLSSA
jgi:hypothetical protein